jgi:Cu-processing system permease protein
MNMLTIARIELIAAIRLKWLRLLTLAFALLAGAAAYSAGAADELAGADGFARTTMTLVPVVLILAPLAALVLGLSGQAAAPDGQGFLFVQPIGRAQVLAGRWLGEAAALAAAIGGGLGAGGVIVAANSGAAGIGGYALFISAAAALAVVFVSIAAAIAAATERRVTALGIGIFVWFFFVLLYDGAMLATAGWLTGRTGGRLLFASVFGNPVDLVRIVTLAWAGSPNVLGAAGDAWMRFLGGDAGAAACAIAAVALWIAAPLGVGARLIARRDL